MYFMNMESIRLNEQAVELNRLSKKAELKCSAFLAKLCQKEGIMTAKQNIRSQYKQKRGRMSPEVVRMRSAWISAHLIQSELFREAKRIYAYAPLGNEADIKPVIEEGWRLGKQIAFPKVFGEEMRYFAVNGFSELEEGTFHVMEPVEHTPVDWEEVLVLVPGVAFSFEGGRMGYGKGYYDRFFADKPDAVKVGVAYNMQMADQLPMEAHDLRMDYLVTEDGLRRMMHIDIAKA